MTTNTQGGILIVGIVKDAGATLIKDVLILNSAFSDFPKVNWFLVESNSSDNTLGILNQLKSQVHNFDFVSLGDVGNPGESRTIGMAIARNRYLEEIRNEVKYSDTKFIVVADLNGSNKDLKVDAVRSCFLRDDWDGCSANQKGPYYDIWALRHELWQPNDCWRQLEFYKKYVKFPEKALFMSVNSKMIVIPPTSDWIEVDSSFGGLGIYRRQSILSAVYRGTDDFGLPICEHVPFHQELRRQGRRLFINPQLINIGKNDHSARKSLVRVIIRILNYPVKFLRKTSLKVHENS